MGKKLKCESCGTEWFVSRDLKMCGPCVTGCAEDIEMFNEPTPEELAMLEPRETKPDQKN